MPAFDGLWSLVTPPGRLLMLRHPGDILPVLHQQPPESLFYPVHVLISLPGVGSSSVASPAHCPVQQRAPVRVLTQDVGVTHHHQQSLGPERDTVNINWRLCAHLYTWWWPHWTSWGSSGSRACTGCRCWRTPGWTWRCSRWSPASLVPGTPRCCPQSPPAGCSYAAAASSSEPVSCRGWSPLSPLLVSRK